MNQTGRADISFFSSNAFFCFTPSYLRLWRVDWKQLASVTVFPALVPYGLAGSSCHLFMTLGGCWSIDMTLLWECWVSPMQPRGRPSSQAPVAMARASALLTWCTWKTPLASAGPPATRRAQVAGHAPKTRAVRVCAADVAITQPCASPACPATARFAGAVTWSVKHVSGRRKCIHAKMHKDLKKGENDGL